MLKKVQFVRNYYLRIKIKRNDGIISLSQSGCIQDVLNKYGIIECKSVNGTILQKERTRDKISF